MFNGEVDGELSFRTFNVSHSRLLSEESITFEAKGR